VMLAGLLAANLKGRELNALFLALPGIDKVLHVAFHALLFPVLRTLAGTVASGSGAQIRLALGVGSLVAIADELVQRFSPGRSVELADLIADLCGLALGWVATVRPPRRVALLATAAALAVAGSVVYDTHVRLIDLSRAMRYERERDFARAYDHYLAAYRGGLRTAALYNGLAWARVESGQGDMQTAVEWGRQAYALEPENADILDTYGWALLHAGRPADALAPLRAAYEKKPAMYCIHYHLAETYRALGRRSEAEDHFERQVRLTGTREAALAAQALRAMRGR
jgi:Tfp pilus assembly protein PilF